MNMRSPSIIFLLVSIMACTNSSHSRFEVVGIEEDNLSDREKISLFMEESEQLSGPAYAAIANLYANDRNYTLALDAVHKAILLEPMNSRYHTLKSNFAYETGDISMAYREALTAYQLGSKSLQQSLVLAKLGVALSEYSIVNNIIDSLILIYPNDPEVIYMGARKFEKSGHLGKAIDMYQKGIQLENDNPDNYYYLANIYLNQGNTLSALSMLEKFLIPEVDQRIAKLKAAAFSKAGITDSAAAYYNFILSQAKDSVIYTNLAGLYESNNRQNDLTALLTRAADSFPQSKYFLKEAGENLDNRFRYEEAFGYYKRLYALDTLDTLVAEELADLQRKIAYLQRRRQVEEMMENQIPIRKLTLPSLDSIK